jgi:hypothetical protein
VAFGVGQFVAVGESSTAEEAGELWSSPDGQAWNRIEIPNLPPLTAVAATADGFVATSSDGRLLTSSDGLEWPSVPSGWSGPLFGAAYGEDATISVGADGGLVHSLAAGVWEVVETGNEEWLYGIVFGNSPGTAQPVFVAVGAGGKILSSFDGIAWQTRSTGWEATLRGVAYGGAGFVAVGDHGVIRHWFRGQLWQTRTVGPRDVMIGAAHGNGIAVAGSAFYDAGDSGITGSAFLVSTNGSSWTYRSSSDILMFGLTYAQGLFVALGSTIDFQMGKLLTSTNGINWTARAQPSNWLLGVAYGNGKYVAVGQNWLNYATNGSCLVSTNGMNWADRDVGTRQELAAIAWGQDRFVAVGHRGAVTISADGETWSEQSSGTTEYLRAVAWGNGLFVAVGHEGTLITSTDGVIWTERDTGTSQPLNSVAYGGGWFVVCGGEGTLLGSTIGVAWNLRLVGSRERLAGVAWLQDSFLMAGNRGLLLRSGPFPELTSLPARPVEGIQSYVHSGNSGSVRPNRLHLRSLPGSGGVDTNAHRFAAIGHMSEMGTELTLDGAVPVGFEYDLFPVETSANLVDWNPWRTLLRSNGLGRRFVSWDDSTLDVPQRYYRTITNHFPATTLQPTGPYPVGRTLRWIELEVHPVRRMFLTQVWYPAQTEVGQVPGRFFASTKLTDRYAARNGRSEA